MFSAEELGDIDDWRLANGVATRADAVRRLCKIGTMMHAEVAQVLEVAGAGVDVLLEQSEETTYLVRTLGGAHVADMVYGPDEVRDLLRLTEDHDDIALRGVTGLSTMLVNIYDVVSAIVEARTLKRGIQESQRRLEAANAQVDKANELLEQSKENRYLMIWVQNAETVEDRAAYDEMSEDDQEAYLQAGMAKLKAEEEADPVAFAERYDLPKLFWERPDWASRIRERMQQRIEGKL